MARSPPTGKPTMPANLTATAGKGAVTLTWDAIDATSSNTNLLNDLQITKHQVRQSTDGGANYETWTDIPNSAYREPNAASYTIGSLTDGTEYTFQVRAVNAYTGPGSISRGRPHGSEARRVAVTARLVCAVPLSWIPVAPPCSFPWVA